MDRRRQRRVLKEQAKGGVYEMKERGGGGGLKSQNGKTRQDGRREGGFWRTGRSRGKDGERCMAAGTGKELEKCTFAKK